MQERLALVVLGRAVNNVDGRDAGRLVGGRVLTEEEASRVGEISVGVVVLKECLDQASILGAAAIGAEKGPSSFFGAGYRHRSLRVESMLERHL